MILQSEISQDSIEKIVCEKIANAPKHQMDQETAEILIKLATTKEFLVQAHDKPQLFQIIEKRVEHCFTFKMTDHRAILFLSMIAENPGAAIMYLWYIQYVCKKKGILEVDFDKLCMDVFPMGFLSQDDLHKIWDGQKVKRDKQGSSDNLVDYADAGLSIQFEEVKMASSHKKISHIK